MNTKQKEKESKKPKDPHFDIHSSIVFQLGEELITDDVQALVELIKNCYDADSKYAIIDVDSDYEMKKGDPFFPGGRGKISVVDNGIGMNYNTLQRGWLTISNSIKKEMKHRGETTNMGRTPLGDKGLGRLGTQRLGKNVEIFTKPEGENIEYYMGFSWDYFLNEKNLSRVKPIYRKDETNEIKTEKGTKIVISDLHSPGKWKKEGHAEFLIRLGELISPYRDIQVFDIRGAINGIDINLPEIAKDIRETATISYDITFNYKIGLQISGKVTLKFLEPSKKYSELFREYVEKDDGEGYFKWLLENESAKCKSYNVKFIDKRKWAFEFSLKRLWEDFDNPKLIYDENTQAEVIAYPGPFRAEIDSFDLSPDSKAENVFDKTSTYREFIKNYAGIRVYRDGFGVRVPFDWLKLGKQVTSGASWYGLRPQNTFGYIEISAKRNACLKETTDRQDFEENPYYINFYKILQNFVGFQGEFQNFIRRGLLDFIKYKEKENAGLDTKLGPEDIVKRSKKTTSKAKQFKKPLSKAKKRLKELALKGEMIGKEIKKANIKDEKLSKKVEQFFSDLKEIEGTAENLLVQIEDYHNNLSDLDTESDILLEEIEAIREQLVISYETLGLGMVAESLSHEISNIVQRISDKTHHIIHYRENKKLNDVNVNTYLEYVKSFNSALRKQLSHLDPALKYVRETREDIDLYQFFKEEIEFFKERFSSKDIFLEVKSRDEAPFVLNINKGKLTQIIDNIILNSEYWLSNEIKTGRLKKGIITIEFDCPYLRIWDNGKGIDPSVEEILFDPFITTKENGRGLGLFIIRQLLDSEDCFITLSMARNDNNRRYIFEINFRGIIDGGG